MLCCIDFQHAIWSSFRKEAFDFKTNTRGALNMFNLSWETDIKKLHLSPCNNLSQHGKQPFDNLKKYNNTTNVIGNT